MDLPSDEVMRAMAKVALEQALTTVERLARDAAENVPPGVSGRDALLAFANAMRTTTADTLGTSAGTA